MGEVVRGCGKIGVRGFPNGIFNPWVRWNTWPGLGREFFRRRRRRRRRRPSDNHSDSHSDNHSDSHSDSHSDNRKNVYISQKYSSFQDWKFGKINPLGILSLRSGARRFRIYLWSSCNHMIPYSGTPESNRSIIF